MKQHVASVRINHSAAAATPMVQLPAIEIGDELRKREEPLWPWRVILRQHEPRCMAGKLAKRNIADITSFLQLDNVGCNRIIEQDFLLQNSLREKDRIECLCERCEVKQRF